jgi:4-carboxymuconolactone decarboxylase
MQTLNESRTMIPALEKYAKGPLSELWKRPGLSPHDRSMVTITALIPKSDNRNAVLLQPGAR